MKKIKRLFALKRRKTSTGKKAKKTRICQCVVIVMLFCIQIYLEIQMKMPKGGVRGFIEANATIKFFETKKEKVNRVSKKHFAKVLRQPCWKPV